MSKDEFYNWVEVKKWEIAKFHYSYNPFYKALVGEHFPNEWNDLPLLNKGNFSDRYRKIFSNGYNTKNTYIASTTGSTGKPLWFAKNKFAHAMTWGIIKNRYNLNGINIHSRQGRFWQIPKSFKAFHAEKLKDLIMNRSRYIVEDFSDITFEAILERLKKDKISYIYGYTNTIAAFAKYLKKNKIVLSKICPKLKSCIVTAEMLFEEDKNLISKYLGVRVINEYGISEIGIVGFDILDEELLLTEETTYYELVGMKKLDNLGSGVGKFILTDLFNRAFPMIRYDVGDIGSIKTTGGKGPFRKKIENLFGRENDIILLSNGKKLPGFSLIKPFDYLFEESFDSNLGKIKEFIFRQHDFHNFTLDIVSEDDLPVSDTYKIKQLARSVLQLDVDIKINRVNSLEPLRNGKVKQFYSLINK